MPAAAVMKPTINSALGAPGTPSYETGKSAVAPGNNLLAAVEAGGLMDGLTPDQQQEVRDILRGMPPDVDDQFMAKVRGQLDNDKKLQFDWAEHPSNGYDFLESTVDEDTIKLVLRTPLGQAPSA